MLTYKKVNSVTLLVVLSICLGHFVFQGPLFIPLLIVGVSWLSITAIGSFHIRWNYHVPSLHRNSIDKNWISLSFDDGPHPAYTPKVLDLLMKHHAKATFFCVGKQVEKHPELLRRIISEGHEIGNHTYSHPTNIGFLSTKKVRAEIKKTQHAIYSQTGKFPLFFRPPFGVTNPYISKAIRLEKLISIGWSIRSLDTTRLTVNKILKRIAKRQKKGELILLHDTSEKNIKVLEQLLLSISKQNLTVVPVSTLFNIKAYV